MSIKQPAERIEKLILVSVWYRGKRNAVLVSAMKVGNHYRIARESLEQVFDKLGVLPGTTVTVG